MKMFTLSATAALSITLLLAGFAQAKETISKADVPVVVQQAANTAAKGGRIVRWEKDGKRYEAVVKNEDGKAWGLVFDEKGKLLTRRDESKKKQHD